MASRTAVSVSQFAEQFYRSWTKPRGVTQVGDPNSLGLESVNLPWKIGLAISGGADSMALAFLCKQMEEMSEPGTVSFTAFLVDHQARAESSQEAHMVAGWLRDMGIKTKILELDWHSASAKPAGAGSIKLPSAFETNARTLRYQALGKACLHADIKTILLGHHQDDNVETAISRLCTGARSAALGGISEMARIPECHGLWGISEGSSYAKLLGTQKSGDIPIVARISYNTNKGRLVFNPPGLTLKSARRQQKALPSWLSLQPTSPSSPILTATGGIFLCRPLLSFPKARLVQTCIENKVPYVSDPTNFDPTLTTRNTIRHLLSKNALPRALQPASMLSLIETGQKSLQKMNDLSNKALASYCGILDFNPRAGSLVITFQDLAAQGSEPDAFDLKLLSHVIRRAADLVSASPAHHYPLKSYEPFVSTLFSRVGEIAARRKHSRTRKPFAVGGVLFSPLEVEWNLEGQVSSNIRDSLSSRNINNVWGLTRTPYFKNRKPIIEFKNDTWKLWDDRHWLRFVLKPDLKSSPQAPPGLELPSLVVRPFQESDFDRVLYEDGTLAGERYGRVAHDGSKVWKDLKNTIWLEANGPSRDTIPVLTLRESSPSGQVEIPEQLLLMPTFGLCLSGRKKGPTLNEMSFYWKGLLWNLHWDWRYKMIDTEAVRLMDGPGVSDEPTEYGTDV